MRGNPGGGESDPADIIISYHITFIEPKKRLIYNLFCSILRYMWARG